MSEVGNNASASTEDLRTLVGKNLEALRKMRNMSTNDVAAIVGVSYQTLRNYEQGTTQLPYETAWALCDFFNIPMAALGGRISFEPAAA